MKLMKI